MNGELDCVFCRIVRGELPKIEIYENDDTLSFMDINPAAPGHVLVIPKKHCEDVFSMLDELFGPVGAAAKRVASAVKRVLNPDGISLVQANGKGAAQSIFHFHIHVVPRWLGDDLKVNWANVPGDMNEIQQFANLIRTVVRQ